MPATSQAQQKLMGMALAMKRGQLSKKDAGPEVVKAARSMKESQLRDFASTQRKGLPKKARGRQSPIRKVRSM